MLNIFQVLIIHKYHEPHPKATKVHIIRTSVAKHNTSSFVSSQTVDSASNVRAHVTSMIQKHSNHTTTVEIARGRFSMHMIGKRLAFGSGKLSICSSNIKAKRFQYSFDQTFLHHIEKSSIRITLYVNSKKYNSIILLL